MNNGSVTPRTVAIKVSIAAPAATPKPIVMRLKSDLVDLPDIVEGIDGRRERFIVFCDDLSFDANEPGYLALKVMLDGTIAATARNAGWLDLLMRPERHNAVKVLLFLDIGGSMDDHVRVCEELFSAAKVLAAALFVLTLGPSVPEPPQW